MAVLTINENPSISDTVLFNLQTPDVQGCFLSNPYKVNNLIVYYVQRDFNSGNLNEYKNKTYDLEKLKQAEKAEALACNDPNDVNIFEAKRLRNIAESNVNVSPFFFNEASPVHIVGNDNYPAWLSTDLENSFLELVDGVYGQYNYTWQPQGMREGDYFICWTWTPLIAGDTLSSHLRFTLKGDTQTTTSIPSHFTNPEKYKTLLDRYTPEMFKMIVSDNDRTPDVLDKFNQSVALGFNVLEDLGNQIVDLQDANSIHESLIPYLSNLFDLKLKTTDPTRWRGQIKRAVPLYKMKGTKKGLTEALEHSAIKLVGLTQLWEVISSYTWQEVFKFNDSDDTFELEKVALPIDYDNFELWMRPLDNTNWIPLSSDYVEFTTSDGITYMNWIGSNLSIEPIDLIEGDEIRVIYKYFEVTDPTAQSIENYIRSLPLMDQRDERDQIYPLKNWNVRVIPQNDVMFDLVIPSRHPYHESIVYGKVRTEFPYSENIYNMEEYNGCCVGETIVTTESGPKKIKDITDDKLIMTEFGFRKFKSLANQGEKDTFIVKTSLGREITVTSNHKFKVFNENGFTWKETKELKNKDYILCKKGNCDSITLNVGLDKELWYLAGHLYGDGNLYEKRIRHFRWLVSETEPEIKNLIIKIIKKQKAKFQEFIITKEKHQQHTNLKCNEILHRIGTSSLQLPDLNKIIPDYKEKGEWRKSLPSEIWRSGEEQICAFLRGIFDADGGIQKRQPLLTTKWKNLALEIQNLLLLIGIISSVTSYDVKWKGVFKKYYRVRIIGKDSRELFYKKINFNSESKKKSLKDAIEIEKNSILEADRVVIPFGSKIIKDVFPSKKRISKSKKEKRSREEKRIITLISRLKQNYQQTIPNNTITYIYQKAEEFGIRNESYDFIKNYYENNWHLEKIENVKKGIPQFVYDPLDVEETNSYISNGIVSHNSIRNSKEPCDIDRNFISPCTACISSNFNIDLEIENLSDDRIFEAKETIQEFAPFHAVLHTFNFIGGINEFVEPSIEEVEALLYMQGREFVIAGDGQQYFNRIMKLMETEGIQRDELADETIVVSTTVGTAYNDEVVLFCPDLQLDRIGMALDGSAIITAFSPSILAGYYTIDNPKGNVASVVVPGVTNPNLMVTSNQAFTFDINNLVLDGTLCNIAQDNIFKLVDLNQNFGMLGVKSIFDVDQGTSVGAWEVLIPAYSATAYTIKDVKSDGSLLLSDNGTLPSNNVSNINYSLIYNSNTIISSNTGELSVVKRGRVTALSSSVLPIRNVVGLDKNFQKVNLEEFPVIGFVNNTTDQYYIGNYQDSLGNNRGDINNTNLRVNKKVAEKQVGYLQYRGLKLEIVGNLESSLGIQNGFNSLVVVDEGIENNEFRENFIIFIESNSYFIEQIDGDNPSGKTTITLAGNPQWWKTLSMGGTSVNINIHKYTKKGATIDGQQFNLPKHDFRVLDRSGQPVINRVDQDGTVVGLSLPEENQINEFVQQNEGINFSIEHSDGIIEQGEI